MANPIDPIKQAGITPRPNQTESRRAIIPSPFRPIVPFISNMVKSQWKLEITAGIDYLSRSVLNSIIARYDIHPADHPLSKYLNDLLARVNKDNLPVKVVVTKHWDDINAGALPHGVIVVSDRFFDFCQYEEELLFILRHELTHIEKGHAAKRIEETAKEKSVVDGFLEIIGLSRLQEYESDLHSMPKLAECGVNPYGGIVFFNRLVDESEKDIEHGGAIDRVLNMGLVTRLYDLKVLTADLSPLSVDLINSIDERGMSQYQLLVSEGFDPVKRKSVQAERCDVAQSASLQVLTEALATIFERVIAIEEQKEEDRTLAQKMTIEAEFAILRIVCERLEKECQGSAMELGKKLYLKAGIDISLINNPQNPLYRIAEKFSAALGTIKEFRELAKSLGSHATGKHPERFILFLIQEALEADLFVDKKGSFDNKKYFAFCREWINRFGESLDREEKEDCFLEASMLGIPSLRIEKESAHLIEYIRSAVDQFPGLPASEYIQKFREEDYLKKADYFEVAAKFGISVFDAAEFCQKMTAASKEEIKAALIKQSTFFGAKKDYLDNYLEVLEKLRDGKDFKAVKGWDEFQRLKYVLEILSELNLVPGDKAYLSEGLRWEDASKKKVGFKDVVDIYKLVVPLIGKSWLSDMSDSFDHEIYESGNAFTCFLFDSLTNLAAKMDKESFVTSYLEMRREMTFDYEEITDVETKSRIAPIFLAALFSKYKFDLGSIQDLRFLYDISYLISDPNLSFALRNETLRRLIILQSGEENYHMLYIEEKTRRSTTLEIKEDYLNCKLNQIDELERLKSELIRSADPSPSKVAGKIVLADLLEHRIRSKRKIFELLMGTGESDREIKLCLFDILRNTGFILEEIGDNTMEESEEYISVIMRRVDSFLAGFYLLDPLAIHALVRFILVGKDGLLLSDSNRRWLLDYFLKSHVVAGKEDHAILSVLRQSLEGIIEVGKMEDLYFAFAPLIEKRILKFPKKSTSWGEILQASLNDGYEKDIIPDILKNYQNYSRFKRSTVKKIADDNDDLYILINMNEYQSKVRELLGHKPDLTGPSAISPIGLVLEIAGKLGSPGVRLLQILGQFIAVPPEYEAEFSKVYDAMRGQTKLTAFILLQREWPQLASVIESFGEPIGGGSLMVTYKVKTKDGKQQVIKVLNPNAEFHLEMVYQLLDKVIDGLVAKHGNKYLPAKDALRRIREWIQNDICFEGFLERDRCFYQQNQGFTLDGSRYSIRVPRSEGPDNKYFKREEYIEGTNLTQLETLKKEGHDLKPIVSLLLKNYWEQIQRGLVHSDVHPGNFRVTKEGEVAILDRNYFIELDEKDRRLVQVLTGSFGDKKALSATLTAYFAIKNPQLKKDLQQEVERLSDSGMDVLTQVKELLVFLAEKNVAVPLKITLLMKNINAFQSLAKAVGFNNLMEAFLFAPKA